MSVKSVFVKLEATPDNVKPEQNVNLGKSGVKSERNHLRAVMEGMEHRPSWLGEW